MSGINTDNASTCYVLKCISIVQHKDTKLHIHEVTLKCVKYTGRSGVTESMVTELTPFCRYNMTQCVELIGEDLLCYSNKTESGDLRQCPHDH